MVRSDVEPWANPDTIRWILAECKTWAIVGLGSNPSRPAYNVARFLQQRGKRIVPVHPGATTVLGEQAFASLTDIPFAVDCVDVFRRVEAAGEFADRAVQVRAKAVWFQLEIVDEDAFARTTAAGLEMVMGRCPAIEWPVHGPHDQPPRSSAAG